MPKKRKSLKICGKGGIIKMNKKQYNNVIENTLKHEQTDDSLSTARAIFDNMGVALPQGDMKTVYETIKTDNYMGWKSCTMQEAQAAADNGTAAIGISEDKIVVLSANDEEQPVAQTVSVMTLDENTTAFAVEGLEYYSYSYGSTGQGDGSTSTSWVDDYDAIYVSQYGGDGLQIVGHAYVFLKYIGNIWVKTEFNTPGGGNIEEAKANAKIYVEKYYTSSEVEYILMQGIRELYMSPGYSAGLYTEGSEFFPIKGNFSRSILYAETYENTNYGGYNLLINNCLHYVKDVLRTGFISDDEIENVINTSEVIEPKGFMNVLRNAV